LLDVCRLLPLVREEAKVVEGFVARLLARDVIAVHPRLLVHTTVVLVLLDVVFIAMVMFLAT
jgi:hypothetical protein